MNNENIDSISDRFHWIFNLPDDKWEDVAKLYKIAPLAPIPAADLKVSYDASMFKCFVYDGDLLVGTGRAMADGLDCSYVCGIAVHPDYQGKGLGKKITKYLVDKSRGHKKIILYANPGKESFYKKFGFKKMNTAMAIFQNEEDMVRTGVIEE